MFCIFTNVINMVWPTNKFQLKIRVHLIGLCTQILTGPYIQRQIVGKLTVMLIVGLCSLRVMFNLKKHGTVCLDVHELSS